MVTLNMEAVCCSETISTRKATWHHNPEKHLGQFLNRENLKSENAYRKLLFLHFFIYGKS
jgi:hypothetical protein